ncbi:50S ribosomal protein L25/general stress protein Ctc [Ornithinibacillus sp. L9]|uniref:Large ribosomal subunit protein bL25 n=1 Tax=Ornithinibacillus caprae TaxID=2678566 RepID=A0A6N8FEG3_9BACI|nr:50S ribosomal protein L25/general stress protein Ctc [Ornithinibacillus caprae]MUK88072.1 50S ribosomal protein L25/general stress protein Ctc [Ornithinibacillus caprae]
MSVTLKAIKRPDHTRSTTRKLRESGQVPAVVYGKEKESKSIAVDSIELIKTVRDEGRNAVISLDIADDSSVDVMLHDYQLDAIKDELVHADFYVVNMSEEMDVAVTVRLEGEPQGVKDGGVLQQALYEVQVRATPNNIPDEITIDVSSLDTGDSLTVADIPKAANYEILDDPESTLVTILTPTTDDDVEGIDNEDEEPELVGEAQTERNAD